MPKATMNEISYGINKPQDLLNKLVLDGEKVDANPHPHDMFNFFVTAAVLNEWVVEYYSGAIVQGIKDALNDNVAEKLPVETSSWVVDKKCLPNTGCDVRRHVFNAMRICWGTANASKHYHWTKSSGVSAIEDSPKIKGWYQYFFTSTEPGIYIEFAGEYYTLLQIKQILTQFYSGLLSYLDASGVVGDRKTKP